MRHRRLISILLLTAMMLGSGSGPVGSANAAEGKDPALRTLREGSMNFAAAVELALQQSPFLVNSSLEIDLKRLDEADSKGSFIPSLSLRTRYFLNPPRDAGGESPFALDFLTEAYNPIESFFSLKARKLLTQIAILAHMQIISDYLHRLALGFLELDALDQAASYQKEVISVSEQNIAFTRNRMSTGGTTLLEVRVAEQEADLARAESERINSSRSTILEGLKTLLGLRPDQMPDLDLSNARLQVLNHFDPASATLAQAQANSVELKIQNLKKQLQERNITLAYTRFLPSLLLGVQTSDPLSGRTNSGLFFSVGLELPIWDGLKRYHNISRQNTILMQINNEEELKEIDLSSKWRAAQEKYKGAAADLKLARSQEELAEIKERQSEISYQAGREFLSTFLAERRRRLDARKNMVAKALEVDKSALELRTLTGDLIKDYVEAKSF